MDTQGKLRLIVVIFLILLLAAVTPALASEGSSDLKALQHKSSQDDSIRILVELQNLEALDLFRDNLPEDAQIYATFETIPIIGIRINRAGSSQISKMPNVVSIQSDKLSDSNLEDSVEVIGMPVVWADGIEGQGQTIVILDTGIDIEHEFFGDRIVAQACFSNGNGTGISLCPNGERSQFGQGAANVRIPQCEQNGNNICWHGTHVAGIAGGNSNEGNGVAPQSNIIAIQVFTRFNDSRDCTPRAAPCLKSYQTDQLRALEYIANTLSTSHNIASVNMSLAGGGPFNTNCNDDARKHAIDNLRLLNIPTIISSGNDSYGQNGQRLGVASPACISTAITIGATDNDDNLAGFTNVGKLLDLHAPGLAINSSVPNRGYGGASGTSMAAPHVAGAWAILKERNPNVSVRELLALLQDNGNAINHSNYIRSRIRVDQAIAKLSPLNECPQCFTHNGSWTDAGLISSHGWFVGDFNGDERDDIFRYNEPDESGADMFLSDGRRFVADGSWTDAGLKSNRGWSVGDFNGDGRDDIFRYVSGETGADMFLSDGTQFVANGSWTDAGLSSRGWFVGDFNGDGRDDIFRYVSGESGADMFLSDGRRFVEAGSWIGAGLRSDHGWFVGDFNGDGRDDIFRYVSGMSGADMFLSDGTKFVADGSWTDAGLFSRSWHIGDFNGDGKDDIFRYVSRQAGAEVFLSDGNKFVRLGSWTDAGLRSNFNWFIGDFNGDGSSDIFRYISGESGADMFLSESRQPKSVMCPHCFNSFGTWIRADIGQRLWETGDFNGDGKDDILRYNEAERSGADVFLSDGAKFTLDGSWTGAGLRSSRSWFVGDFNGDGRDDIFRYVSGESGADMFLSNGTQFVADGSWTAAGLSSHGWFVGDFNGDGKDDIFRYVSGESGADMFLSNGTQFVADGSWTDAGLLSRSWFIGDFNGDGKDDIFRYNEPDKSGADVYLSDGTQFIADGSWTGAGLRSEHGWFVGDFNGDGKDDIFRYVSGKSGADMFLSDGSQFRYDGSWTDAGIHNHTWFVGDYNGDSTSDLLRHIASELDNEVLLSMSSNTVPLAPSLSSSLNANFASNLDIPIFNWQPVTNTVNYALQWATSPDISEPLVSIQTISSQFSPDSELVDETYYWRVRGQNASGIWGDWSETWQLSIDTIAPIAPMLLLPQNNITITNSTPELSWSDEEEEFIFHVQLDNANRFENLILDFTTKELTVISSVELDTGHYYWRVRTRDLAGNWGQWSNVSHFSVVVSQEGKSLFLPLIHN